MNFVNLCNLSMVMRINIFENRSRTNKTAITKMNINFIFFIKLFYFYKKYLLMCCQKKNKLMLEIAFLSSGLTEM